MPEYAGVGVVAVKVHWILLRQRVAYGTIRVQIVTHRLSTAMAGESTWGLPVFARVGRASPSRETTPLMTQQSLMTTRLEKNVWLCHCRGTLPKVQRARFSEGSVCTKPFMVLLSLLLR